ncbi:hypothetical protein GEMRC1_004824 [Eukaryota sp. GEM-RC1]
MQKLYSQLDNHPPHHTILRRESIGEGKPNPSAVERGPVVPEVPIYDCFEEAFLLRAKVMSRRPHESSNFEEAGTVSLLSHKGRQVDLGKTPSLACEVFFKQEFQTLRPIPDNVIELLQNSPNECSNNIIVTGGIARTDGFVERLLTELSERRPGVKVIHALKHDADACGKEIRKALVMMAKEYGGLEAANNGHSHWVLRSEFEQNKSILHEKGFAIPNCDFQNVLLEPTVEGMHPSAKVGESGMLQEQTRGAGISS